MRKRRDMLMHTSSLYMPGWWSREEECPPILRAACGKSILAKVRHIENESQDQGPEIALLGEEGETLAFIFPAPCACVES